MHARPGVLELVLRKRHGFIRLAIESGSLLVPILSFGENGIALHFTSSNSRFISASREGTKFKDVQVSGSHEKAYWVHDPCRLGERRVQL